MSCAFASICARRLPDVTISAALPGAYQMNLDRPSFAQLNVNELLISPLASMIQGAREVCYSSCCAGFSAVVAGWRVAVLPDVLGAAPAPTAPGRLLSGVAGAVRLVRRVRAERTAAASRPGRRPSRARCG
jgi:hypothetical protein